MFWRLSKQNVIGKYIKKYKYKRNCVIICVKKCKCWFNLCNHCNNDELLMIYIICYINIYNHEKKKGANNFLLAHFLFAHILFAHILLAHFSLLAHCLC